MIRIWLFRTFCCFLASSVVACTGGKKDSAGLAQAKNEENFGTRDGEKDADFVVTSVEASYAEIKMAQLAMTKSPDMMLKDIAMQLEKDNSRVLNELKDLSYKKGIAIPVEESEHAKIDIRNLQKEDQQEFRKDWLKKIKDQHESTIRNFESTLKKTTDRELKSWIHETLPDLRSHLDSLTEYGDTLK